MKKMMLKIVDGFNGWEDDRRFRSEERAEKMVARYERQFAAANPGAYSSYEIVPVYYRWYSGRGIWAE